MRQNTWPICQSYWVSCRAVDVRRFRKDYRKSSLLYWLLRMSMLNPRRETKQEHFMKEAALVESVCRSRWASWGSSDACCFRRSHFDLTSTRAMACPILFTRSTKSSTETRFNTRRFCRLFMHFSIIGGTFVLSHRRLLPALALLSPPSHTRYALMPC